MRCQKCRGFPTFRNSSYLRCQKCQGFPTFRNSAYMRCRKCRGFPSRFCRNSCRAGRPGGTQWHTKVCPLWNNIKHEKTTFYPTRSSLAVQKYLRFGTRLPITLALKWELNWALVDIMMFPIYSICHSGQLCSCFGACANFSGRQAKDETFFC